MQYSQQKSKLIGKRACREGKKTPCSKKMLWWENPAICYSGNACCLAALDSPDTLNYFAWGNFGAACTRYQPLKATSHQIHIFFISPSHWQLSTSELLFVHPNLDLWYYWYSPHYKQHSRTGQKIHFIDTWREQMLYILYMYYTEFVFFRCGWDKSFDRHQ